MPYDDTQLKIDLDHITSLPQWQDETKRRDFAREVAIAARQEGNPEVDRKFIPALWAAVDGGMLDKAGNFVKRGVEEVVKSMPAGGGALAFAAGDALGLTDSGSATRFKRGVAELVDGTGQRLKQLGSGEFMGMNVLPGQSKQKAFADTLSELKKDLDTGAIPEGLTRWLAGEHDDGSAPDEETGKWVGYLTHGLAKMAVEADHMGEAPPEKVRAWMESDRNPAFRDSDTPGDPGPRELLADYVATGDPQSWSAFEARVRETDAQRTTRLQRYAAEGQVRQVAAAMPEGLMKDLTQRSFDMQTSPIDLATSVLPLLRGSAALKAAKAGAKGSSVAAQVLTGGLKEAAQEAGTEYLGNPNASTSQVLEAGALGAVGSVALEGTMGGLGKGIRRVTLGPQMDSPANASDPSTPPPDAATQGGNVLAQIAARGGRVDAPLEADPSTPVPDAGTGAAKPESSAPPAAYPSVFDMTPSVPTNPDTAAPPAVQPAPAAEAGSPPASVSAAAPGATLPSATAPTTAAATRLPTGQDQVSAPVETGLPATPTAPDAATLRDTAPTPAATPQGVSAPQAMPGSEAAAALPTTPTAPPTSPSQATAPTQPRQGAETVTRTRAAERVLTTQGVDPETAAVLAARLSETLPADMPLEQLRERVMEEFTAAGGSLPGSVPRRRSLQSPPDAPYHVTGGKRRLLYSRPAGRAQSSLSPQSRAKLAQSGVNLLRQNAPEIAQGIRLVTNRDALTEADFHPDDWAGMAETEGFFDPRTGQTVIFTDQVEIREGETMPRAIVRVAIHERLGHAGMEALRQSDPTFAKRWAAIVESIESDPTLSAEVAAIAEQPGYEHLAGDPNGLVEEWFARRVEALSEADLKALKPTSALGRLWQALKDLLNRWTRNFSRSEWTARELREVMSLSKQALRDGGPVGVESDGRVKQARKLNPFHGSGLPNWLKKPFNVPAHAPFRVQNLGLRALLKGSALPSELLPFARQSERDITAIRQTSAQIGQDLNESLTAYAERSGKTLEEVHELAAKAMEDPVILQALPDPVMKERVRRARNLLDDLSAAVGKFAGGDLGAAILKNRGHWMRRSYACFDEASNWTYDSLTKAAGKGEKINGVLASKVLKDARDYVTRNVTAQRAAAQQPAPKPGEIEAIMRQLTDRNVWERNLLGNMQGSGVSKDVTSLMHRAAYHPDVAAWMKRNAITDWDYQTVASLAATGGNWQGRNAAVTLAAARASLAAVHPKASAAEINDMLRQQDIAAPLRALMGEEVNPVKRFLSSSSFQAQYIARHEQQVAMRDLGLQMGLFSMQQTGVFTEELGDGRERNGFQVEVPQTTPNGQTVMVRKAIYTTPETMVALSSTRGIADPADVGNLVMKTWYYISGATKMNKVTLNPDSWAVNLFGNMTGLVMTGDLVTLEPWKKVMKAYDLMQSGKAKRSDVINVVREQDIDARRELMAKLTSNGVLSAGLTLDDVNNSLNTGVLQFIEAHDYIDKMSGAAQGAIYGNAVARIMGVGWIGRGIGAITGGIVGGAIGAKTIMIDGVKIPFTEQKVSLQKVAEWTTGAPDRFAKIVAFYGNYEAHLAAGMHPNDAVELAAEKVINTMPNYSKLPALMRQLSRLGGMSSFVAFRWETFRNAGWNAYYCAQELRSGNAALVVRGMRRFAGTSSLLALAGFGAAAAIRGITGVGVDDDEDEAYRKALGASWERFGNLSYTRLDGESASFFNTSYLIPQGILFEVMRAGMEGRDLGEAIDNIATQQWREWMTGSVHADPIMAAFTNHNEFGKISTNEGWKNYAERLDYLLFVALEPGAFNKADRVARAMTGATRYGREFSLEEEMKRLMGIRLTTNTHERRLKSKLIEFKERYADAKESAKRAQTERPGSSAAAEAAAESAGRVEKLNSDFAEWLSLIDKLPINPAAALKAASVKRTGFKPLESR